MALQSHKIDNDSLENWVLVGEGGFSHVYKARHKDLCIDVAIKILHHRDGHFMSLRDEAINMSLASCEFVVRHFGTYHGCPNGWRSMEQGLVMDFMERGSVESLQKDLSGPPPWPLVCRLVHQVAQGMNFLQSKGLVHHDLKPSNVLLNVDFNAKIADFGLSRHSTSTLNNNREAMSGIEGSYKYMPPEALEGKYETRRAFDIYSYGILLWSIITGKEPYPYAIFDQVEQQIPSGKRPCCDKIVHDGEEGFKELDELMKRCWNGNATERPLFKHCLEVTENVFSKQKNGVHDAVGQVLTKLQLISKSPTSCQLNTTLTRNVPHQPPEQANDDMDSIILTPTKRSPIRESVRISTTSTDKAKFVDDNIAKLIQKVTEVMAITKELGDMVNSETYSLINAEVTDRAKMRVLYRTALHSGGEKVKSAFYDALNDHHPKLVERLGGAF